MSAYNAIIIDDEFAAREILALELKEIAPDINIIASCDTIEMAHEELTTKDCDIAFIDIILPRGNGLDLLRNIPNRKFYPVIVSSHLEYAIEAIKEEAFDYILKPFETSELQRTLERFRKTVSKQSANGLIETPESDMFEARDQTSSIFIPQGDISHVQANGSYSTIHYRDKEFVMSKNLKHLSLQLNPNIFYRCSHKFLVNLTKIERVLHADSIAVLDSGATVNISSRRKEELMNRLRKL